MRRWRPPIGNMDHVDAGHHPEQFAAEMAQISGPARPHVDLARIRLGVSDELRDRLGRNDGLTQQDEGIVVDARDRSDVARDVEVALLIERHVDRVRRGDQQERVAVSRRAHDRLQARLPPPPGRLSMTNDWPSRCDSALTDQARDDVGRAAGGNEDDQSAPAATDRLAPAPCATRPAARQRPRPDAEIVGGEVSSSPLRLAKVHSITSLARQVMAFMCARRPAGAL